MGLIRRALKGSLIVASGNYIVYGINILAQLWLIRLLSPSDYGQYAIILVIAEFAYVLLTVEFATACVYDMENDDVFHTAVILAATWSIGIGLLLWALGFVAMQWTDHQTWVFASFLVLLKAGFGIGAIYGTYLERDFRFGQLTIVRSIAKLAALAFGVGLAENGLGIRALLAIDAANYLLAMCLTIAISPLKIRLTSFQPKLATFILRKGFSQFQFRLSGIALYRSPVLLVQTLTGDAVLVGFMDRAMYLALLVNAITSAFTTKIAFILFKKLSATTQDLKRHLDFMLWLTPRLLLPVLVIFLAYPDVVVHWLYGEKWAPVAPLLSGLAMFSIVVIIYNIINQLYMAMDRLEVVTISQWAMLISFVAAAFIADALRISPQMLAWIWSVIFVGAVGYLSGSAATRGILSGTRRLVFLPIAFVVIPSYMLFHSAAPVPVVALLYLLATGLLFTEDYQNNRAKVLHVRNFVGVVLRKYISAEKTP